MRNIVIHMYVWNLYLCLKQKELLTWCAESGQLRNIEGNPDGIFIHHEKEKRRGIE